jgi:hypothetical protein
VAASPTFRTLAGLKRLCVKVETPAHPAIPMRFPGSRMLATTHLGRYNLGFMCNRLKFPFIKRERQVIFQLCPIGNSATPADARCTDPGIRGTAAVPKPFAERWHR